MNDKIVIPTVDPLRAHVSPLVVYLGHKDKYSQPSSPVGEAIALQMLGVAEDTNKELETFS